MFRLVSGSTTIKALSYLLTEKQLVTDRQLSRCNNAVITQHQSACYFGVHELGCTVCINTLIARIVISTVGRTENLYIACRLQIKALLPCSIAHFFFLSSCVSLWPVTVHHTMLVWSLMNMSWSAELQGLYICHSVVTAVCYARPWWISVPGRTSQIKGLQGNNQNMLTICILKNNARGYPATVTAVDMYWYNVCVWLTWLSRFVVFNQLVANRRIAST